MSENRCSERTHSNVWGRSPCSRAGVVEENGRWWCKQHVPSAVKARRAKRDAKWKAERERKDWGWQHDKLRAAIATAALEGGDVAAAVAAYREHEKTRPGGAK